MCANVFTHFCLILILFLKKRKRNSRKATKDCVRLALSWFRVQRLLQEKMAELQIKMEEIRGSTETFGEAKNDIITLCIDGEKKLREMRTIMNNVKVKIRRTNVQRIRANLRRTSRNDNHKSELLMQTTQLQYERIVIFNRWKAFCCPTK